MRKLWLFKLVIFLPAAVALLSINAIAKETDCGLINVQVIFQVQNDVDMACEGIRRAIRFFASYGFSGSRRLQVRVLNQVIWESLNTYAGEKEKKVVYACYDNGIKFTKITSWETDYVRQRKVFGILPISREYHTSIVAHEVAHDLFHQVIESIGKNVERPITEFVSYVVQIETMKEPEKSEVLELWPNAVFRSDLAINSFSWLFNPHKFGVMSYRYYLENPDLMKYILLGEVESGDMVMPN